MSFDRLVLGSLSKPTLDPRVRVVWVINRVTREPLSIRSCSDGEKKYYIRKDFFPVVERDRTVNSRLEIVNIVAYLTTKNIKRVNGDRICQA